MRLQQSQSPDDLLRFSERSVSYRHLAGTEANARAGTIFQAAFSEVRKVYREISRMSVLKRFLRGFFFYSMGVQTVMMAATIFGDKLLHLDEVKLIVTVVLIQLVAIIGATWMSRLSAKYGNLRVLMRVPKLLGR